MEEEKVYKHRLVIEMEGTFSGTVDYLESLESLPWQLYWDEIDYQVARYPLARVKILLYSLGPEEGWVGV